ncbi:hypothetical protein JCM19000A_35200 [Silvimonas sp. JCM 19000]
MHPAKVDRNRLHALTDLPNVGPAVAADLRLLGIDTPEQLRGRDPYDLYDQLCSVTATRHDPCMIDTFIAVTRFMDGAEPQAWWAYTAERKQRYAA